MLLKSYNHQLASLQAVLSPDALKASVEQDCSRFVAQGGGAVVLPVAQLHAGGPGSSGDALVPSHG